LKHSQPYHKFVFFLIPLLIWLVYTGVLIDGRFRVFPNFCNYFKDLSLSFLAGRLDVDLPQGSTAHDLIYFKGKYYLYWPPVPAVVYIPFTLLFGRKTPDSLINTTLGALNVFLLMILLSLFSRKYRLQLSNTAIVFLAIFWGLGTVHFYMSMAGSVWYVGQVMAQSFLMLSVICMLAADSALILFLSGLFYALAVYTRNTLVFSIFLLFAVYITSGKKSFIKDAVIFLAPFIVFSLANLAYNQARFGSIFDNGLRYHLMHKYFAANFEKYGCLSLHYVPGNFVREVIMPPPLSGVFPFFKFDPQGFGFLIASPAFILIFAPLFYYKNGFKKHILKLPADTKFAFDDIVVMTGAAVSALLISFLIFTVMGTGWAQFASRYSLDYQLMMLLFGLFIVKICNKSMLFNAVFVILLLLSVYINYFGARFCWY
jgi:hypothetical protein